MIMHWWLYTFPSVSGILRAVFYLGLLVLCLFDNPTPLSSAKIIGKTEPAFYTPVAVLRVLHIRWVRPPVLSFVSKLTIALWIAAVAGLLQPITAVLTFLGFAFLHAVPGWESYDALELTCRTSSGDVVLGRALLAELMTLERG